MSVINPATGGQIECVPDLSAIETRNAIQHAQSAQKYWQRQTAKYRSKILRILAHLIEENQEDLAVILTLEQGKVLSESRAEIAQGAAFFDWFADEARRIYGDTVATEITGSRALVIKQPVGVVAAITPWNFPHSMIARKVAPALAAGCAIIVKPAGETPLSALALAELANRAGVPAGVFNVITSANSREIGKELTTHPVVRKVSFTGSTPVGKTLMKQSADTVKRTSMELGGNAPVIVFADADLDLAVTGAAASKYRNSGQTCICANRILVQDGVYDEFVAKFVARVQCYRLGNGLDAQTTHGPLISSRAVTDVHKFVQDAVEKGAVVKTGGKHSELGAYFYEPTVLSEVNNTMRVFREEIFGPIAPIFKFSSEQEAIAMANDTEFGLASYIYTRDLGIIWRVSEALEYGMVGVNEVSITSEAIPFGGVKESGQGREGSKYGLDDYLEKKYICLGGLGVEYASS